MKFWKYRDRPAVDGDGNFVVGNAQPVVDKAAVDEAYRQGRKDEKARRKSHPILALIVFLLAIVGGVMLFLAIRNGSFSGAGQDADQIVATAAAEGPGVVRGAAAEVGEAARNATDESPST